MAILEFGKLMLKNLFSKPVTTSYPAEPAVYPERSRGHVEIDIDKCISCTICAQNCPPGALQVDRQKGTWTINRFDCIACGYCVTKCPKKCLSMAPGYQEPMGAKSEEVFQRPAESMVKPAPKKPTADSAPEAETAKTAEASDGEHVAIDINTCVSCTLCAKNCPAEALVVDRKEGTWVIDRSACITCGLCVTKCPKKCLSMESGSISEGVETFKRPVSERKK